jgi:nucleoid-associated protein EbfC
MFKGLGGLGNLGELANLMKEAGKMKERLETLKTELGNKVMEGNSGGGMVCVKVNGRQEIISIVIDNEVFAGGDKALVQDLVTAACNSALNSSKEMMKQELSKITGGLNLDIPGLT